MKYADTDIHLSAPIAEMIDDPSAVREALGDLDDEARPDGRIARAVYRIANRLEGAAQWLSRKGVAKLSAPLHTAASYLKPERLREAVRTVTDRLHLSRKQEDGATKRATKSQEANSPTPS